MSASLNLAAAVLTIFVSLPGAIAQEASSYPQQAEGVPWPTEAWPAADGSVPWSREAIEADIRAGFAEDAEEFFHGGRGVVVIHKGQLVAEAYREGYGPRSVFISWSQAKSITQALAGIAVKKGTLDVDKPVGLAEWQGDGRAAITTNHLLRMTPGLKFEEGIGGLDDNSVMMFGEGHTDMGGYAASLPLVHEPGTTWGYRTGTTMILSSVIRDAIGGGNAYRDFIYDELLDPLGMKSAVAEFDQAGTFLGGAFFYATTRDYAKFGLLYLRGGVWDGNRILPEGWVDYSRSVTPGSDGTYGAHFWLGSVGGAEPLAAKGLSLPGDIFAARGMGGQFIAIIPSRDVVIAYNGYSEAHDYGPIDVLFAKILKHLDGPS